MLNADVFGEDEDVDWECECGHFRLLLPEVGSHNSQVRQIMDSLSKVVVDLPDTMTIMRSEVGEDWAFRNNYGYLAAELVNARTGASQVVHKLFETASDMSLILPFLSIIS